MERTNLILALIEESIGITMVANPSCGDVQAGLIKQL